MTTRCPTNESPNILLPGATPRNCCFIRTDRFWNRHSATCPNYYRTILWLVCNNTRVIQARLHFRKETGALIEIFCLEPLDPCDYLMSFQTTGGCVWRCLVGNLRKWKNGRLSPDSVGRRAGSNPPCRTAGPHRQRDTRNTFLMGQRGDYFRLPARSFRRTAHTALSQPGDRRE